MMQVAICCSKMLCLSTRLCIWCDIAGDHNSEASLSSSLVSLWSKIPDRQLCDLLAILAMRGILIH
jgi:hypothetical protein